MRDPRALLAAQIALEKTRQTRHFSVYYVVAHWRIAAMLAQKIANGSQKGLVVPYEQLAGEPGKWMQQVCDYLDIHFYPEVVLNPTKIGQVLERELRRGRSVLRNQRGTGNSMAARTK